MRDTETGEEFVDPIEENSRLRQRIAELEGKRGPSSLREYQNELLEKCRKGNTIAVLPTGAGKTHIAAKLIAEVMTREPEKVAIFLAPTVPLATQQYEFLMEHTRLRAALVTGDVCAGGWGLSSSSPWKAVRRCGVVVMTPALLAGFVEDSASVLSDISIVVFDECHNARGEHPYAAVAKKILDAKKVGGLRQVPLVLGLSASPASGRTLGETLLLLLQVGATLDATFVSVERERQQLVAHVRVPDMEEFRVVMDLSSREVHEFLNWEMKGLEVELEFDSEPPFERGTMEYDQFSRSLIRSKASSADSVARSICLKVLNRAMIANDEISSGEAARIVEASNAVIPKKFSGDGAGRAQRRLKGIFESFFASRSSSFPKHSAKFLKLVEVLKQIKSSSTAAGKSHRMLVFSKTRMCARKIAADLAVHGLPASQFVGHGPRAVLFGELRMTGVRQAQVRKEFEAGKFEVLVATSVAEEGIDISACNAVVRFDTTQTTLSMIQSRGRARAAGGRFIVIFHDSPADADRLRLLRLREAAMNKAVEVVSKIPIGPSEPRPTSFKDPRVWAVVDRATEDDSCDEATRHYFPDPSPSVHRAVVELTCKKLFECEPFVFPKLLGTPELWDCKLVVGPMQWNVGECPSSDTAKDAVYKEAFEGLSKRDLLILPAKAKVSSSITPPPVTTAAAAAASPAPSAELPVEPDKVKNVLQFFTESKLGGQKPSYEEVRTYGSGLFQAKVKFGDREFVSDKLGTKQSAQKDAAMKACRALWQEGLLYDMPVALRKDAATMTKPPGELTEANAKNVLQHWYETTHESKPRYETEGSSDTGLFISKVTIVHPCEKTFASDPKKQKIQAEKHVAFLVISWVLENTDYTIPPTIPRQ